MPHVIVKLWPGPTEEQKSELADRIVKDVMATLGSKEASVSVAIEEVDPREWTAKVYETDIAPHLAKLHKKPGYGPA